MKERWPLLALVLAFAGTMFTQTVLLSCGAGEAAQWLNLAGDTVIAAIVLWLTIEPRRRRGQP